ncbi:MAG: GH25 family lysozyme [Thomasclavelia sp.]
MEYGIDISASDGKVDFKAVKDDGNNFVIIKAGSGFSTIDPLFESNYYSAKNAGLKVGAYWYSYAVTTSQAITEAKACYEVINGKTFDYPIYIYMDEEGYKKLREIPNYGTLSIICEYFCMYLEANGYFTGVYASKKWFDTKLRNIQTIFDKWVASYDNDDYHVDKIRTAYRLHQYTTDYYLNGKYYSRNVVYDFNYPLIIKKAHLNGL